ncbi:MAG: hypothetical protein HYY94_03965 [Gemmatimonadetes bacterium]|nr:hypothetical protein [Gemmatimonadota bacterium]
MTVGWLPLLTLRSREMKRQNGRSSETEPAWEQDRKKTTQELSRELSRGRKVNVMTAVLPVSRLQ